MKTATVTWITYNNYGTLLQAYALQKQLELLGHENVILSDEKILKEYRAGKRTVSKAEPVTAETSRMQRLFADPGRILRSVTARSDPERYGFPYEGSQVACEDFRRECLNIRYDVTGETLSEMNGRFDTFLCGSDQIWSLRDSIFNPYYFLDFVRKPKVAYGPSLGMDEIPRDKEEQLKHLLADFTALSAREAATAEQLSCLTGREVAWVADPTLLHDRLFWEKFASGVKEHRKKYLLCYFLENKQWYFDYAGKMAKKLGLKLLLIPNKWDHLQHSFVAKDAVGPKEFVALFQNADYVLTDSYHGSIFSMIFEKDFLYLQRFPERNPESQNIRIRSLFSFLDIEERIVCEDTASCALRAPDYQKIGRKLNNMRGTSQAYLQNALR